MQPVQETVKLVLAGHDPYPALPVHGWALVAHNRGTELLTPGPPRTFSRLR